MTDSGASTGEGRRAAFPRAVRITTTDEIRTLFRRGKRRKTRHLDVFVSASPVGRSRFGLVVPKPRAKHRPGRRRVRAPAVQRNRLKRRLREIARTEILPRLGQRQCEADLLVRARPEAYGATFDELKQEMIELEDWLCSSAR